MNLALLLYMLGVLLEKTGLILVLTLVHTAINCADEVIFALLFLDAKVILGQAVAAMGAPCCLEQIFMVRP